MHKFVLGLFALLFASNIQGQVTAESQSFDLEKGTSQRVDITVDSVNRDFYVTYILQGKAKRKSSSKKKGTLLKLVKYNEDLEQQWEVETSFLKGIGRMKFHCNGEVLIGTATKRRFRKTRFEVKVFDIESGNVLHHYQKKKRTGRIKYMPESELMGDQIYFTGVRYPSLWFFYPFAIKTFMVIPAIIHFQWIPFYKQYPVRYAMNYQTGSIRKMLKKNTFGRSAYGTRYVNSTFNADSTGYFSYYNKRYWKRRTDNIRVETDLVGNELNRSIVKLVEPGSLSDLAVAKDPKSGDLVSVGSIVKKRNVQKFYNVNIYNFDKNVTSFFLKRHDKEGNLIMEKYFNLKDFPELYNQVLEDYLSLEYGIKASKKKNKAAQRRIEAGLERSAERLRRKDLLPFVVAPNPPVIAKDGYVVSMELSMPIYATYTNAEGESRRELLGYKKTMGITIFIDSHGNVKWHKVVPLLYSHYADERKASAGGGSGAKKKGGKKKKSKSIKFVNIGLEEQPKQVIQMRAMENGNLAVCFSDGIDIHVQEWNWEGEVAVDHGVVPLHNIEGKKSNLRSGGLTPWYDGVFISYAYEQGKKKKKKKLKKGEKEFLKFKFSKITFDDDFL